MKRFIVVIILLFGFGQTYAQSYNQPKLVLNISIAGMRYDYLLRYGDGLGVGGIKRLKSEGASCELAKINYLGSTTISGVATIASGTTPSGHGVIGEHWYDYTTNEVVNMCYDKRVFTVGADELDAQLSPRSLVASTIGDCIKDLSPSSKVVSVAVSPTAAILAGGFLCDDSYWVSPRDGKMVTSSFYSERLADWVTTFNDKELARAYCEARWTLARTTSEYYNILRSEDLKFGGTAIDVSTNKYNYERLTTTPAANSLIKDFAVQAVIAENLGKGTSTDYLSVTFEGLQGATAKYGAGSMECEDVFYRLDDEISTLISFLESYIGKGQLLVVLTSPNGTSADVREGSQLPSGLFNAQQFEILINGFLGAQLTSILSDEQLEQIESEDSKWVLDFTGNQLYLNRRKIYGAGLSLLEVQNMVAQFAIQFRGVASAVTSMALQNGEFERGTMGMAHRSYFPRHSGDVVINLLPGWIPDTGAKSASGSPYNYDTHVPLIFWGGAIKNCVVEEEVSLEDIAPTISKIVGVTSPNSSTGKSIPNICN